MLLCAPPRNGSRQLGCVHAGVSKFELSAKVVPDSRAAEEASYTTAKIVAGTVTVTVSLTLRGIGITSKCKRKSNKNSISNCKSNSNNSDRTRSRSMSFPLLQTALDEGGLEAPSHLRALSVDAIAEKVCPLGPQKGAFDTLGMKEWISIAIPI